MLSSDTQKLLKSLYYYPANASVQPALTGLRIKIVDPVYTVDNAVKLTKAFEDVVSKRAR
jgi:hypothetical protein